MKKKRLINVFSPVGMIILFILIFSKAGAQEEMTCRVESISMNRITKEWDGQWQGIMVASDGNCYFGTSTHSRAHGAGFHKYNPQTGEHTVLAKDMTIICGEKDSNSEQGKIHSPIVEHNGWLYFTTHLSNYWPEGIDMYPGAHVIGYELATGRFRDLGIIKPHYSIYSAINVDPERNLLYVLVAPFQPELIEQTGCYLYSIDIASGDKTNLAQLTFGQKGASFWFFVDNFGNCWFTLWKAHWLYDNDHGNLYCYRPDPGELITYKNVLPSGQLFNGTIVTDEKKMRQRAWTWAQALPGKEKCLFTMGHSGGGDERLWLFDPGRDIENGEAFQPLASIGSTFLETALGGDRVYFVQFASLEDQRTYSAEREREKEPGKLEFNDDLHLRSVSIDFSKDPVITDHGKIVDQDGRRPRMINSLAADDQGYVYMMGSWYINNYREASMQILFSKHPGKNLYKLKDRGEFFAVTLTDGR